MINIGVIDIGSGNFGSLNSALKKINYHFKICKNIEDLQGIKKSFYQAWVHFQIL